jgi:hypothetical protein
VFINAKSSLGLKTARSITLGTRLTLGAYRTELAVSTGNFSFVQAIVSRSFASGSLQCVAQIDQGQTFVLYANKNLADTVQAYSSCMLGSSGAIGAGIGLVYQGANTLRVDTKLGSEAGCTASLKRMVYGYMCKFKLGISKGVGGLFGFHFMRQLHSGKYSLAVNVNNAQGVFLVIQ